MYGLFRVSLGYVVATLVTMLYLTTRLVHTKNARSNGYDFAQLFPNPVITCSPHNTDGTNESREAEKWRLVLLDPTSSLLSDP